MRARARGGHSSSPWPAFFLFLRRVSVSHSRALASPFVVPPLPPFFAALLLSSLSHPRTVRRVHVHRHAAPHTRVDTAREIRRNSRVFPPLLLLLRLLFVSSLPLRSLWKERDVSSRFGKCPINASADARDWPERGGNARNFASLRGACARDKAQNFYRFERRRNLAKRLFSRNFLFFSFFISITRAIVSFL